MRYNDILIPVNSALHIIKRNTSASDAFKSIKIKDALNYILYENVKSPINMPPFRQSAVDGYALHLHDKLTYKLNGEIKAGDNYHPTLKKGEAIRIFTGAPVPDSCNAIMMQEKVTVTQKTVLLKESITPKANIRPLAEQIKKNEIALKKGTRLNPAAIAFLASLGITEVNVFQKPSVAIVVTGNELVEAGKPLKYGEIYESNAIMLASTLKQLDYHYSIYKVKDNYEDTLTTLDKVISVHNVILVSGGISVGDYDFVGKALKELHVRELFYKVKQKPGKPLFFGKKDEKYIFALPGNPAAALTCFYIYVYSTLQRLSGQSDFKLNRLKAKSTIAYTKKGDRAQFLKAIYENESVTILEGQNSSMLHTFAISNALVFIPENTYKIDVNDELELILLP